MTISSIIVLCGIVSVFLVFGGVLAWADFYSRKRPDERPIVLQKEEVESPMPLPKAA